MRLGTHQFTLFYIGSILFLWRKNLINDQKFGGVMDMFRNLPEYMIPYKRNPYTQEMKDAAVKILDQGASMVGRMREEIFFEKEVADFCGKRFGISCIHNAMHLLVDAAEIGPGDEVVIPPNTFTGMSQAIEYRRGRCVFVDVEEETFNLDPELIEAQITDRTKIIFPLHSQGHPADMDPIIEIAEKYGIHVFENIVHAMGGKYKGTKVPVTEAGSTSFSLKCLWLPGGGGMVVTDNEDLAEAISLRR